LTGSVRKSIREAEIEFRPLNVLVGANGAGKANIVGPLRLVKGMMERRADRRDAGPTELD